VAYTLLAKQFLSVANSRLRTKARELETGKHVLEHAGAASQELKTLGGDGKNEGDSFALQMSVCRNSVAYLNSIRSSANILDGSPFGNRYRSNRFRDRKRDGYGYQCHGTGAYRNNGK